MILVNSTIAGERVSGRICIIAAFNVFALKLSGWVVFWLLLGGDSGIKHGKYTALTIKVR